MLDCVLGMEPSPSRRSFRSRAERHIRHRVVVTGGSGLDSAIRRVSGHRGGVEKVDIAIIGGGPAGAAAAIRAARLGAKVVVFEKGSHGRDKVCGDGLTPRAVGALNELDIDMADAHRIRGLRMIAGKTTRELDWPTTDRFPNHGAVWPRRRLDAALIDAAAAAGADIRFKTEAMPLLDGDRVIGVEARPASDDRVVTGPSDTINADLTILAAGPPGGAARLLGANRVDGETFGLAIRTYAATPRHGDEHLEAMLSLKDENGTAVPGYGWMFPAGDGTVNIGVGALSTMKGFKKLNLNTMIESYRRVVEREWELGPNLEKPRAWRLPMSAQKRFGPGWVAIGDAAGLVNPMNGEGIDYGLESGMLAADLFVENPATAPSRYDQQVGERFDGFLRTGRRFSFLIGHPWILKTGLKFSVSTESIANITLAVMGNLVDNTTPGAAGKVMWAADKGLGFADPILRKTRAAA
jgi:menaquinone-9 beta-reductase